MKKERYFEATEFENIKEIIYNSAEKYGENTAFILKHKKDKEVEYENISYKRLLKEINYLGTKLFDLVKKEKYNVNSIHSMIAPKGNVEKYARISAISYDNLVESFELDNKKFVMGIKWHPELMLEDEFSDKLFKKFISKC